MYTLSNGAIALNNPEQGNEPIQGPTAPEAPGTAELEPGHLEPLAEAPDAQSPEATLPDLDAIRKHISDMPGQSHLAEPESAITTAEDSKPPQDTLAAPVDLAAEPPKAPGSLATRLAESARQAAADRAYAYLGDHTPGWIMKHVPVYRAVGKEHAGLPSLGGISEWTIGSEAKKHALTWVNDRKPNPHDPDTQQSAEEVVAIRSTLGKLAEQGTPEITHYGDYGSTKRKVVFQHASPETPVTHEVIKSNKK